MICNTNAYINIFYTRCCPAQPSYKDERTHATTGPGGVCVWVWVYAWLEG